MLIYKLPKKEKNRMQSTINTAHTIICGYNCKNNCIPDFEDRLLQLSVNLFQKIENNKNHLLNQIIIKYLSPSF